MKLNNIKPGNYISLEYTSDATQYIVIGEVKTIELENKEVTIKTGIRYTKDYKVLGLVTDLEYKVFNEDTVSIIDVSDKLRLFKNLQEIQNKVNLEVDKVKLNLTDFTIGRFVNIDNSVAIIQSKKTNAIVVVTCTYSWWSTIENNTYIITESELDKIAKVYPKNYTYEDCLKS